MYKGELISLGVALSWTICAMFAEVASKRMGSLALNVIRMVLSLMMLSVLMMVYTSHPYPVGTDAATWGWLLLSGLVGYVIGDFCLFNCYIYIGSRYGQLLMTLAPPAAAVAGWIMLGETMSWMTLLGMLVTMAGIAIPLLPEKKNGGELQSSREESGNRLPAKGIVLGVIAGLCQGVGLVLSARGIDCYKASLLSHGMDPVEMQNIIPFSSTFIRACMGLAGFSIWTLLSGHGKDIPAALADRKGMLSALGATVTGPFLGVSLSLMATMYTNAGIAQTIMAITPVMIIFPTWLFFKQKIRMREVIGAVVAVAGVSLFFMA